MGIVDEQANATGWGVFGVGVTGLGIAKGVGDAAGLGEALAFATGEVFGVCETAGAAALQAVMKTSAATTPAFLMLAITLHAIGRYERRSVGGDGLEPTTSSV